MPEGICNKCGERQELVLADCVCGSCNDRLDRQWATTSATNWVLVTRDIMTRLKESLRAKRGDHRIVEPTFARYVFRNMSYALLKLHWANDHWATGLGIGDATSEDIVALKSHDATRMIHTCIIRPATPNEIADYDFSQGKNAAFEIAEELNIGDDNLIDVFYDGRAKKLYEEARTRLAQLGLLEHSAFASWRKPFREWWTWYSDVGPETQEETDQDDWAWHSDVGPATQVETDQDDIEVIIVEAVRIPENWGLDEGQFPRPLEGSKDRDVPPRRNEAVEETVSRFEQLGFDAEKARAILKNVQVAQEPTLQRGLSQVAGMADLKEQLMHDVIGPFKDPELYRRYRVSLPNGIPLLRPTRMRQDVSSAEIG
jgi:hypothetical protein